MKLITTFFLLFFIFPCCLKAQIPNDTYAGATLIELELEGFGTQINGNLFFATPSFTTGNSCSFAYNNDLWYKFVAPSEELLLSFNSIHRYIVYSIENGVPIEISCSQQSTAVTMGQTYYLRVLQFFTTNSSFYFTAEYALPPDPIPTVDHDECANAIPASVGIGSCGPTYTFSSDSISVSNPVATCHPDAKDIWYSVVAPPGGTIELTELSGNITYVSVYNDDCNALVALFQTPTRPPNPTWMIMRMQIQIQPMKFKV